MKIVGTSSATRQSKHDPKLQYEIVEDGKKVRVFKVHPAGTRAQRRRMR